MRRVWKRRKSGVGENVASSSGAEILNMCPFAELFLRLVFALMGISRHGEFEDEKAFRWDQSGSL